MRFKFEENKNCAGIYLKINFEKIQHSDYVMEILDDILSCNGEYATYNKDKMLLAIYDLIGHENVEFAKFQNGKTYVDIYGNKRIICLGLDMLGLPNAYSFSFNFVYTLNLLKFEEFNVKNDTDLHNLQLSKILLKNKIFLNNESTKL